MVERFRIQGWVVLETRTASGRLVKRQSFPNLVTQEGRRLIMQRAGGLAGDPISHVAVGEGFTPARSGNTALEDEVYRDVLTNIDSPSPGELVSILFIPTHAANPSTMWEAGLFNASTGGTMYARTVFNEAVEKTDQVSLQITWTLKMTVL